MSEVDKLYNSFEVACDEGNFENAEQVIQKLEQISKKQKGVNDLYSQAVAKALEKFKGRFSSTKVKKMIANIEELVTKNPKDEKLTNNFAKVLRTSLIAMSSKGQPNAMQEIITYLEDLADSYPDNIIIQEELSLASHEISHYWKTRGDFKALRVRTKKFRKLAEKFPDNEKIKLNLTRALVLEIDSSQKSDIAKIDNILLEIQELSESMPANIGLQLEWVHAYRTAMDRSHEKPEDAKRWLSSMKKIADNKKDEAFKLELAKGYLNAISFIGEQNKEELSKHLDDLEMLANTTKDNLELQTIYAQSLITSLKIIGTSDKKETQEILDELKELVDSYPTNNVIVDIYVQSLIGIIGLLAQEQKAKEISVILDQFEELKEKFEGNELIEKTYEQLLEQLKFIGYEKEKKKKKPRDLGYM